MVQRRLLKPPDEAGKQLTEQIQKGERLVSESVRTHAQLEQYKLDRQRFTQYNIEMLTALFGDDYDAFWRYRISQPAYGVRFENELDVYRTLDREQVNELRGLEESLSIIPRNKSETKSFAPPVSKSWRQRFEEHPFTLAITVCVATATIIIVIMIWVNSSRIDNLVSKYEADESNMRAQYEAQIRDLQAKIKELESKNLGVLKEK